MSLNPDLRARLGLRRGTRVLFVNVGKTWPANGGTVAEQEEAGLGDWVLHQERAAEVSILVAWKYDDVVAAWAVDDPVEVRPSAQGTRYRFRSSKRLSLGDAAELRRLLPDAYRMYSAVKYLDIK